VLAPSYGNGVSRSLWLLGVLCWSVACHETSTLDAALTRDDPALARAVAPAVSSAAQRAAETSGARLPSAASHPAMLAELAARGRERCPDEVLSRGSGAQTELAVHVADVRADRRSILPLDLGQSLASDAPAPDALYAAELLVSAYEGPHHFRRLNAPRSEWAAGRLEAQLLVWDLQGQRVVCQATLKVRGDATGAPVRRRLRESTRQLLETKLYGRARAEMQRSLAGISSVFRLSPNRKPTEPAQGS
jgi:hypothetical protein